MKVKLVYSNLFFSLTLTVLYLIYNAVLSPIYISICSNVVWLESKLPYLLEILLELCQLFIWVHLISSMIYAVKRRKTVFFMVSTVVLTLARYLYSPILNIAKGSPLDFMEIFDSLIYFGADMLILAIVFIAVLIKKNKDSSGYLHFGSLLSAILISASKISSRIIFDIYYGAPQSTSEIIIMILYYFSDVLYGAAVYFLVYFMSKKLDS